MYDFLIIGQGLAGTLIGYRLEQAGKTVFYLDAPKQTAASTVAAGIINPITGRRFVKSWRIDELLPEAEKLYAELEAQLDVKIRYELPLIRTLFNRGDKNDWDVRSGSVEYEGYLNDKPELENLADFTQPAFAYGGVRKTSRIDLAALVKAFDLATSLANKKRAVFFDYDQLVITDNDVSYKDIRARQTIFCEGWRARFNPWFNYLPHRGAKGEVLFVKLSADSPELIFKHRVFLVPQGNNIHWIGSTNENNFTDDSTTPEKRQYLEERLNDLLTVPYTLVDHKAAIRPTVKDRRPLLGVHPIHKNLFIFNGLGTKGASLAPLCSRWLADFILADKAIPDEVNISRFPLT